MARPLPAPTAAALDDLRHVGRYLDHLAETSLSDHAHALARANAIRVWQVIDRVQALAEIVEDLSQAFQDPRYNPYDHGQGPQ